VFALDLMPTYEGEHMILKLKNPNPPKKNPLRSHKHRFSKVAVYKINIQKSVAFLYIINEQSETEIRKAIPFTISSKNQNTGNKFNEGGDQLMQ
jgi:hypothetical protein